MGQPLYIHYLIRKLLVPLLFVALIAPTAAQTNPENQNVWNFTGENQPVLLKLFELGEDLSTADCLDWPDVLYANYAQSHPQYKPLMHNPNLRRQWRRSLILQGDSEVGANTICFFISLWDQWVAVTQQRQNQDFLYCGADLNAYPPEFIDAARKLHELLEYGLAGGWMALSVLKTAHIEDDWVKLNSDIDYQAYLAFQAFMPKTSVSDTMVHQFWPNDPGRLLTNSRRQFVEQAFLAQDHQAVISSTDPC